MLRWHALPLGLALGLACHELPSSVPLSNTGAPLEETGTDRDRRPASAVVAGPVVPENRAPLPLPPRPNPLPAADTVVDAGAGDAALVATDGAAASVAWAGEYSGNDRLVRHFDDGSDDVELDDKARTRVEETAPGALLVSIVNSASGDVICALRAAARGASATLEPGQSCFADEGADASVTDGSLSLSGDRLVLDFTGKIVEGEDEDEDSVIEFRIEYHFDGRRR